MSNEPFNEIEMAFIREFSHSGNVIALSENKIARRERVRQAIFLSKRNAGERFQETSMNYAEAFQACYGERLDRRAAIRPDKEPSEDDDWDEPKEEDDSDL